MFYAAIELISTAWEKKKTIEQVVCIFEYWCRL